MKKAKRLMIMGGVVAFVLGMVVVNGGPFRPTDPPTTGSIAPTTFTA